MAVQLTSTGLQIDTFGGLQAGLFNFYQNIYGQDINLSSETADGQTINNYVQSTIDNEEAYLQTFNSMDPDNAIGTVLDQRCAINGIQRQQGTYTTTNVNITFGSTATLYGLDQSAQPVYTVTDTAGSMDWELITTVTKTAGSYELAFQAAQTGAVLTIPGTITVPVTVVIAVTAINNDEPYTSLGTAQESDNQLKIRRQQSTSIGSQGYYNGLVAQLENIAGVGVGNVKVYENDTASTSNGTSPPNVPSGIPSHSIYVVVGGGVASESTIGGSAGANAPAIAQAIYNKRNAGCGMFGAQSYAITQADSTQFPIYWDVVQEIPLFIKFTVGSVNGTAFPNIANIVSGLPSIFQPGINQTVNINQLINYVTTIDPNTYVSNAGFSTSSGGSYTATLAPAAGDDQFQVLSSDIIVTPMLMTSGSSILSISAGIPLTFTVSDNATASGSTIQYSAVGGYGSYTWSIPTNNSGGSISSSGLYTPGATGGVSDTLKVQDSLSNFAEVTVAVAS